MLIHIPSSHTYRPGGDVPCRYEVDDGEVEGEIEEDEGGEDDVDGGEDC